MRVQLLVLKRPQQLVRQRDAEAVLASIRIVAFPVHGRFIRQVCHVSSNERSGRLVICGMAGINVNSDGALLALLAGPAVHIVLITLERYTINDAGYGSRIRVLSLRCRGADCKLDHSHCKGNRQPK